MTAGPRRIAETTTHLLRMLGVVAMAAGIGALAACEAVDSWDEVHTPPQPQLAIATHDHQVFFAHGSATLAAGEQRRLQSFVETVRAERGGAVVIEVTVPTEGTPLPALAERRARAISGALRGRTPRVRFVAVDPADPWSPNRATVSVESYVVKLPACPDWSARPGLIFDNQSLPDFGCATAVNFGLMVANPADLAGVEDDEPATGERQAKALERYRTDTVKPFIEGGGGEEGEPAQIKISTQ